MKYFIRFDDGRWLEVVNGGLGTPELPSYGCGSMELALKQVDEFRFVLAFFAPDSKYRTMEYSIIPESDIPYWTENSMVKRHGKYVLA
jgi:hypothetical protein